MEEQRDKSKETADEDELISSDDIMQGEVCIKCGFRCIQGCV